MTVYRVLVNIPATNGLAADGIVNSWGVEGDVDYGTWYAGYLTALRAFYDAWGNYRSGSHTWTGATTKLYNLADALPRVPLRTDSLGLSSSVTTTRIAPELAICCSFQGDPESGVPQNRRRGRVYLGPWGAVAQDTTTGRPATALITAIKGAGTTLAAASEAAAAWSWVVISEAGATPHTAVPVTNGWVDDAWDIQRRRGILATSRGTWT